jgi:hypothetical protein
MNKEQILEKIMRRDARVEKTYTDPHDLASYLATIEERLEKVEGKTPKFIKRTDGLTEIEYYPTPTECEHKHRGLYGECLKCTEKLDDSPTEVKDWEVRFDEHMNAHKAFDLYHLETAKSFIRNLLK